MKKIKAFTLAELLSVLIILGVVAMITIPSTVNRVNKRANRTKLQKAMAAYDSVINKIVVEHNIRSLALLNQFDNAETRCSNIKNYFKVVEERSGNHPCEFKTADGVWWNVGEGVNLSKIIVAFKDTDLTVSNAVDETNEKAFYLQADFDRNGSPRVLDHAYGWNSGLNSMIFNTAKINSYLGKKDAYQICDPNDRNPKSCMKQTKGNANCTGTKDGKPTNNNCEFNLYDANGKPTLLRRGCKSEGQCSNVLTQSYTMPSEDKVQAVSRLTDCDNQGDNCKHISIMIYDRTEDGMAKIPIDETLGTPDNYRYDFSGCSLNTTYETRFSTCEKVSSMYIYRGSKGEANYYSVVEQGKNTTLYSQKSANHFTYGGCDSNGKNCTSSTITIGNGGGGDYISFSGCDGNGTNCKSCSSTNDMKYVCPSNVSDYTKNKLDIFGNFSIDEQFGKN